MIRIGIYDNEPLQAEHIRSLCDQYFQLRGLDYECILFDTESAVLLYTMDKLHLLFIGLENGSRISGIEIMHKLEDRENVWSIVFVADGDEYMIEAFGIKTLGYGRKPLPYALVDKWLNIVLKAHLKTSVVQFKQKGIPMGLRVSDIIYIKAEGSYIRLVTAASETMLCGNLKSWYQKLDCTSMLRVHKSYLVNMQYIKEIGKDIQIQDGGNIPIGRSYRVQVLKQYENFRSLTGNCKINLQK